MAVLATLLRALAEHRHIFHEKVADVRPVHLRGFML